MNKTSVRPRRMRGFILRVCACIPVMALIVASCGKDPLYVTDPDDAPSGAPMVTVLYDPGALGDMTYNDLIYAGVERAAAKYGLRTRQLSPSSKEEGMKYVSALLAEQESARDTVRHLLIVPGASYEEYLRANNHRLEANPRADLLFFGTTKPFEGKGSSLHISFYGAMYEAGAVNRFYSEQILLVAANPKTSGVADAVAGCRDGFWASYTEQVWGESPDKTDLFLEYLADEPGEGFTIDDASALNLMLSQPWQYGSGIVIPVCGGANAVFRRMAEYTGTFKVLGIDRVIPSTACNFAAIKHSDVAAELCIGQWMSAEGLPKHQTLGLADGFTEMVYCSTDGDTSAYDFIVPEWIRKKIHQDALEKEAAYGK